MTSRTALHQDVHYEYLPEGIHCYNYYSADADGIEQMVLHLAALYEQTPTTQPLQILHDMERIAITPYLYQIGVEIRRVTNSRQARTAFVLSPAMMQTVVPKIRAELPHRTQCHQREAFLSRTDALRWLVNGDDFGHNKAIQSDDLL